MQTLADLSVEFGWGPSAWRSLTVFEFRGWVAELKRRRLEQEKAVARARHDAEVRRAHGG